MWSQRRSEHISRRNFRHGFAKRGQPLTGAYRSWSNAKTRCFNQNHPKYPDYAGRGITMCEAWRNSFAAFLYDMGERPPGMTIERIDNDGPYSPYNCRWALASDQPKNRRPLRMPNVRMMTLNGVTKSLPDWARQLNFPVATLWHRVRAGWSDKDIITLPIRRGRKPPTNQDVSQL